MASGVRITVRDKGARALLKRIGPGPKRVRVGVFGDASLAKYESGRTVGEMAAAAEYGRGNQPTRSWLRGTVDTHQAQIDAGVKRLAEAVLRGRMNQERALSILGLHVVGLIKARIAGGIAPALNPRYLQRKLKEFPGANTPLVASSQFLSSVTFAIEGRPAPSRGGRKGRGKGRRINRARRVVKRARQALRRSRRLLTRSARSTRKTLRRVTRAGGRGVRRAQKQALRSAVRTAKRARASLKKAVRLTRKRFR